MRFNSVNQYLYYRVVCALTYKYHHADMNENNVIKHKYVEFLYRIVGSDGADTDMVSKI